jgi:hypothetical protein
MSKDTAEDVVRTPIAASMFSDIEPSFSEMKI